MSDRDFQRVAQRVSDMAGIVLEPHKQQMIVSRLSRRLRALGIATIGEYLDRLDAGRDLDELQEFINTLTTNLTSLFREAHHFVHLRAAVLEPYARASRGRLRIWSAGCSSGEEAYSIGLCLLDILGSIPADARILATDIDTRILERARRGHYPAEKCADVDPCYRRFLKTVPPGDEVSMPPSLVQTVAFRRLNLLEPWPMQGKFDAIFCRNVMIYFSQAAKIRLIDRFADLLVPRGYLYLGHSESLLGRHPRLESIGETVYRLRAES